MWGENRKIGWKRWKGKWKNETHFSTYFTHFWLFSLQITSSRDNSLYSTHTKIVVILTKQVWVSNLFTKNGRVPWLPCDIIAAMLGVAPYQSDAPKMFVYNLSYSRVSSSVRNILYLKSIFFFIITTGRCTFNPCKFPHVMLRHVNRTGDPIGDR